MYDNWEKYNVHVELPSWLKPWLQCHLWNRHTEQRQGKTNGDNSVQQEIPTNVREYEENGNIICQRICLQ